MKVSIRMTHPRISFSFKRLFFLLHIIEIQLWPVCCSLQRWADNISPLRGKNSEYQIKQTIWTPKSSFVFRLDSEYQLNKKNQDSQQQLHITILKRLSPPTSEAKPLKLIKFDSKRRLSDLQSLISSEEIPHWNSRKKERVFIYDWILKRFSDQISR